MPSNDHTGLLRALMYKSDLEFSSELELHISHGISGIQAHDCCEDLHLADLKSLAEKQQDMK